VLYRDMRKKLYFLPVYIGSLKYYAKLFPYLEKENDVSFLIVRGDNERRRQMIEYCKKEGYPFEVIDSGLNKSLITVPFVTSLFKRYIHARACRKFLANSKADTVITTKVIAPHDVITNEVKRLGIKLLLLQWSSFGSAKVYIKTRNSGSGVFYVLYYRMLDFFKKIVDLKNGYSGLAKLDSIGMIDPRSARFFTEQGGDPSKIHIVGTVDHQIASEARKKTAYLKEKYGVSSKRLNILVLSYRFHRAKLGRKGSDYQIEYFRNIFSLIRSVYSENEANVLFKLHPAEENIYSSFEELGVGVCGDESETHELIGLSDLCITDPWTTANHYILGSGIPTIFVNLSSLTYLNSLKDYYNIRNITTRDEDFSSALQKFKAGELEKQYDNNEIDTKSIGSIVSFIIK